MRTLRSPRLRSAPWLALAALSLAVMPAGAQRLPGTENGEWRYLGGDAGHTRSSPLDQINAGNFGDLEQAWLWSSRNFGPNVDYFSRSTPIYVGGRLFTVANSLILNEVGLLGTRS